jgi:hypothetical protein
MSFPICTFLPGGRYPHGHHWPPLLHIYFCSRPHPPCPVGDLRDLRNTIQLSFPPDLTDMDSVLDEICISADESPLEIVRSFQTPLSGEEIFLFLFSEKLKCTLPSTLGDTMNDRIPRRPDYSGIGSRFIMLTTASFLQEMLY